ncbi:MAG: peptide chain release factor N(5)-glutamine methyltransferase [Oscillospiraceae bacterium]
MGEHRAQECIEMLHRALSACGMDNTNEINVLLETATGKKHLSGLGDIAISDEQYAKLRCLLKRRIGGEPLQYIAGSWPFLDFELQIGSGVLIPRPETEELALHAIELVKSMTAPRVIDLCSGSGCVAIALKRAIPEAEVTAVELSDEALKFLDINSQKNRVSLKIEKGDVFVFDMTLADASADLITANPPYVTQCEYDENAEELKNEPLMAFIGGEDGLDFYRHIIPSYKSKLKSGGRLIFESGFNQTEQVKELFLSSGYTDVEIFTDLFGLPRNIVGTKC